MSLKIGIVGLPNVGKSTLFNSLIKNKSAEASNYPFCTIDPNVGIVEVPDQRLKKLAELDNPAKIIPAAIEFVDIAGLVKGASQGEGLGNKFLANIRECDAIAQVLRLFEDKDITHVHESIDPARDKEIIESELLLADLQTLNKRLDKARSNAKSGDKEKKMYVDLLERLEKHLSEGKLAIHFDTNKEEKELLKDLHLLTMKPIIYVLNIKESQIKEINPDELREKLGVEEDTKLIPISAKMEEELISFEDEEAKEYLDDMGLKETGLNLLIVSAYETLGLITYFTSGEKETRAWTIKRNSNAVEAAGKIHTDFMSKFVKAEVTSYDDYIAAGGEKGAKEKGLVKIEGKDYIVKDGDVIYFRISG